jgi:simple sugar transport system permease protein
MEKLFKDVALLLGIAIALAPAFKMKFWNIGAQGQILIGGVVSAACMIYFGGKMNNALLIALMFIVSVVLAGLWAVIPAIFKVKWGANETLFTLMMNYIAIKLVDACVEIWKGEKSSLGIIGNGDGYLPTVTGHPYLISIIIIVIITVLMYFYLSKTKHGYEISVVGESLNTANYAGINTKKVIIRTMFLSGAICGVCGFLYVSGLSHTVSSMTGGSNGFTAIIVAWVANFNPIYMALISFLLIFLRQGCNEVVNRCSTGSVNASIADIVIGIFLFFIIGCEFFINYKVIFRLKKKNKTESKEL